MIRLAPVGLTATSGPSGNYSVRDIPVEGDYSLIDITVTKKGFGKWEVLQNPIYSGENHYMNVRLGSKPVRELVGPPLSEQQD